MRDPDEATDGPTDPRVDPEQSPGFGEDPEGLADIEVDRDVTIGEASPRELQATDLSPVVDDSVASKIDALENGDVVERRRNALALGDAEDGEAAVTALASRGLADPDADVRQFSVEALGQIGGDRAAKAAVGALDDENPWVRAEAIVALDRIDRAAHESDIEAGLEDDHHAVRRNAAVSLFKRRGEAMRETLLGQTRDESERVREWAAHLLAGVEGETVDRRLAEMAGDESEPKVVRSTAARSLEVDAGKFRRQFTGGTEDQSSARPGESRLNRRPDL